MGQIDRYSEYFDLAESYHGMWALLLLGAAGDRGGGGDDDEGEGPRHLAEGGADVVDRFPAQLEAIHLEDLVCNRIDIIIVWSHVPRPPSKSPK